MEGLRRGEACAEAPGWDTVYPGKALKASVARTWGRGTGWRYTGRGQQVAPTLEAMRRILFFILRAEEAVEDYDTRKRHCLMCSLKRSLWGESGHTRASPEEGGCQDRGMARKEGRAHRPRRFQESPGVDALMKSRPGVGPGVPRGPGRGPFRLPGPGSDPTSW